jgi:hypothetical protein
MQGLAPLRYHVHCVITTQMPGPSSPLLPELLPLNDAPTHCHERRHVRGFICRTCNLTFGLMKENPEIPRAAADYLEAELATRIVTLA